MTDRYSYDFLRCVLPGLTPDMPEPFHRLAQLLCQDFFELIEDESDAPHDARLIFQMNDCVESYLIFRSCHHTGHYDTSYDGPLEAELTRRDDDYVLVLHQGDTPFLLFFRDLIMEDHYYNYGEIGHVWVKGYEYLRILSGQIWNLWDKYTYMGANSCNPLEQKLVKLMNFPPLNYACYSYLPDNYIVPIDDPWALSPDALQVFEEYTRAANDSLLLRALNHYKCKPSVQNAKHFAKLLHRSYHSRVTDLIARDIVNAAKDYPDRVYSSSTEDKKRELLKLAETRKADLESRGKSVSLLREEPFLYEDVDGVTIKYHLLIWKKGPINRTVAIETFQ